MLGEYLSMVKCSKNFVILLDSFKSVGWGKLCTTCSELQFDFYFPVGIDIVYITSLRKGLVFPSHLFYCYD